MRAQPPTARAECVVLLGSGLIFLFHFLRHEFLLSAKNRHLLEGGPAKSQTYLFLGQVFLGHPLCATHHGRSVTRCQIKKRGHCR